ncbi:hypothetical protein M501DRAFT_1016106 [Patellaria atrata CBS 101060]|uniref:Uncharacterized protein n=1 Tax=Patellaria atrata CBS 101060 TaxID=1346257 RepID=A0A9P4VRM7_9PEZI|nr:hypothetical protein M501DRAFT_1016106 [Patellaria atrata CBS 101060]
MWSQTITASIVFKLNIISLLKCSTDQGKYVSTLRLELLKFFQKAVSEALVPIRRFCMQKNISPASLQELVHEINDSSMGNDILHVTERYGGSPNETYVYTTLYWETIKCRIVNELQNALESIEETTLTCKLLPGNPPLEFIKAIITSIENFSERYRGRLNFRSNRVEFTPMDTLKKNAMQSIENIIDRQNMLSYATYDHWISNFPEIYGNEDELRKSMMQNGDRIMFLENGVLETAWFENDVEEKIEALRRNKYVEFPDVRDEHVYWNIKGSDCECLNELQVGRLKSIYDNESQLVRVSYELSNNKFYLVDRRWLEEVIDFAGELAKTIAQADWDRGQINKEEVKFIPETILFEQLRTKYNIRAVNLVRCLLKSDVGAAAASAYREHVNKLTKESEQEFASFWRDSVSLRVQLYTTGVTAIPDDKMQTQFRDLLENHISKELVTETLARAESKHLLQSSIVRKDVQKLRASLDEHRPIIPALDKFASKRGVPAIAVEELGVRKKEITRERVAKMRNDKDPPRLFLTLVVILWEIHNAGLIYTTGKFSPKLLKSLQPVIAPEMLEKLEVLKAAVKAGSVTDTQKQEMRTLAQDACL